MKAEEQALKGVCEAAGVLVSADVIFFVPNTSLRGAVKLVVYYLLEEADLLD